MVMQLKLLMGKRRHSAFGLLEMMFVLFVMSILLVVTYYQAPKTKTLSTLKDEVSQVLIEAHQEALMSHSRVDVDVLADGFKVQLNQQSIHYTGVHVKGESFYYTESGTISKSQTWMVQYNKQSFKIIFYLGSGYFVIQ